jgi:hypothetical protein
MRKVLFFTLIAVLALPLVANAAELHWITDSDGTGYSAPLWDDPLNWSPEQAPTSADDVYLDTVPTGDWISVRTPYHGGTSTSRDPLEANTLTVSGGAYSWDVNASARLTLFGGNFTVTSGASWTATSDRSSMAVPYGWNGTWNIAGDATFGSISGGSTSAVITKTGAGTLTLNTNETYSAYTGHYSGTINIAEGAMVWDAIQWGSEKPAALNIAPGTGVTTDVILSGSGDVKLATGGSVNLTGTVDADAVLTPGNGGIGTFNATGSVAFNANSVLSLDLGTGGAADALAATGTLSLNTGSALYLNAASGLDGTYTLASTGGITGTFSEVFYNGSLVTDLSDIGGTHSLSIDGGNMLLSPAGVVLLTWTNANATGTMADNGNWSAAPLFDGTEVAYFNADAQGTVTLDGDRAFDTINVTGNYTFNSGSVDPSTLTVVSGNMNLDANGGDYDRYPDFRGVTVQVGDGTTAVTDATWTVLNTNGGGRMANFGVVNGIAGTVVTLDIETDYGARFSADNSTTYLGDWVVAGVGDLVLDADNALGTGTVTINAATTIQFNRTEEDNYFNNRLSYWGSQATSHDMNIVANANMTMDVPLYYEVVEGVEQTFPTVATLNGDISGAGNITLTGDGHLVVNGDSTRTGTFSMNDSNLIAEINGTWTDSGNISVVSGLLQGTGTIGLAAGAKVDVVTSYWNSAAGRVAPGTDGTVGTLTIGTPGNSNVVHFNNKDANISSLLIDVIGTESDQLVVNGVLDLDHDNKLEITGTLDESTSYTLASYDSLVGTFTEVFLNGSTVYNLASVGGTHELIYGETALTLASLSAPPAVVGDVNGDGIVDYQDLGIMAGNWNMTSGADLSMGDLNGDGAVDYQDLGIMAGNWNYGVTITGTVVPEPATMGLLAIGGIAALIRRRRS